MSQTMAPPTTSIANNKIAGFIACKYHRPSGREIKQIIIKLLSCDSTIFVPSVYFDTLSLKPSMVPQQQVDEGCDVTDVKVAIAVQVSGFEIELAASVFT